MRIAVSFALDIPDDSLPALIVLAAAAGPAGARRFVQAEAEQTTIDYLTDNGIQVVPIRGVALPDDYPTNSTRRG